MTDKQPIPFLDLKAQQRRIAADLRRRLDAVLEHCQFVLGPEVRELEAALAKFCGARYCVGVSSGTDALQIAMMAEGIGRGDAVFLPAFTYAATAEVSIYVAPAHQRRGVGRRLLSEAIARGPALGLRTLLYVCFAHNAPSLRLSEGLGFARWGHLPRVADMDGIERDVVILGRRLGEGL